MGPSINECVVGILFILALSHVAVLAVVNEANFSAQILFTDLFSQTLALDLAILLFGLTINWHS
jgi:hypothetical protein